jgi:hypothetical protein
MGLFKQMKQMKDVVAQTPEMIESAQAMQQSQQAQAVVDAQAAGDAGEPIAGVSLELYAEISRELTARGGDQALAPAVAKEKGVDQASWDAAVARWNDRMRTTPAIATRFNQLWRGVG